MSEPSAQPASPSTSDPDDWETHWGKYAGAAEHNPAQSFRRRVILGLLTLRDPPHRYLDIGSGQGDLALAVSERWPNAEIAGIDLSTEGVEISARKLAKGRFQQADVLGGEGPAEDMAGWATHATCSEVLEHVDQPEAFIRSAARWLAPGAVLAVTTPGGERSAFDVHIGHRRHYTASELAAVIEAAGFSVVDSGGAGFPFFNLYRRVVIARGDKLVDDFEEPDSVSLAARVALGAFDVLLRVSATRGRRGLQTYVLATAPVNPQ